MHRKTTLSSTIQGAILATFSALLMSALMSVAKKLTPDIPTPLVTFIRSGFGLLFSLPFLMRSPKKILQSNQYALHGIRIMLSAVPCCVPIILIAIYHSHLQRL